MFGQSALIDAATRLGRCANDDDRWVCATDLMRNLGSDWISSGTAGRQSHLGLSIRTSTPDVLMRDYIDGGIHLEDPWMAHCASTTDIETCDLCAAPDGAPRKLRQRQAALFADHGVRRALLIPCYSGPRTGGIVVYARSAESARAMVTPEGLAALRLATALVAAHYRPEGDASGGHQLYRLGTHLTPREREVLQWLSRGFLSDAIADRMRIAPVTVAKHLQGARRKLGARTREQALAIAIRDGLIGI